jgi:hypothetical protein
MSKNSITCVACGAGDQVRAVGAVVLDGHTHTHSTGSVARVVGLAPAIGVISQQGVAVTQTAQLLAPPPLPPPRTGWYAWIAVLTAYCLCWAVLGVATWPSTAAERDQADLWAAIVGPTAFAAPGLIALTFVIAGLIRRRRKDRTWRRVAPYVARLHGQAWYCGRCAGVFFVPGTVPGHVPTETLIPITDFRDTLWRYGHRQWEFDGQARTR